MDRISRRGALASLLGAPAWLPALLTAADTNDSIRLAISENLVSDVNLNDARAAMQVWLKRMMTDLNIVVDINLRVFDTSDEIVSRARNGQLDSVAINILEYRRIDDLLDSSQILAGSGATGAEQYVLLVKGNGEFRQLANLKGRRLCVSTAPKMCIASDWLATVLNDANLGHGEQFFGSVTSDRKPSRVILPVFFGQADACMTSKRNFDTMCELNPQVGKDLAVVATSQPMVVTFYAFHKSCGRAIKERLIKALAGMRGNPAWQLATMFQFEELAVRDGSCLSAALEVLKKAEHGRNRPVPAGRKG